MANRKRIPREPPRPVILGGARRPSLRVSLAGYEIVARRRALNARLLAATCAFTTVPTGPLSVAEVELLQRMTSERFSAEQVLLRMQAVRELGRGRSVTGVDHLVGLVTSPVESEQLRAASGAALVSASPHIAHAVLGGLTRDPSHLVKQTAARLAGGVSERSGTRRVRPTRRRRRQGSRAPMPDAPHRPR